LSRMYKDQKSSDLNIGSFQMDDVRGTEQGVPTSDFTKEDTGYGAVSSWDLPMVEQDEKTYEHKEDFKAKLARLEKEAYEKGFEQGQRDGFALEKRKIEEVRKQVEDMFMSLRDLKPGIYAESEGELLKLAMLMTRKIIGEEIKINSGIIGSTIKSAMKFLTDKRKVRIILNPDDMDEVKKLLPDISSITKGGHFQLSEDRAINRGGCILETGFGKINACIEDQIINLEKEIDRQYGAISGTKS
jgi:flagellar assembly protein FliH